MPSFGFGLLILKRRFCEIERIHSKFKAHPKWIQDVFSLPLMFFYRSQLCSKILAFSDYLHPNHTWSIIVSDRGRASPFALDKIGESDKSIRSALLSCSFYSVLLRLYSSLSIRPFLHLLQCASGPEVRPSIIEKIEPSKSFSTSLDAVSKLFD